MTASVKRRRKCNLRIRIMRNWRVYVLVLPALVILIWFRYIPMIGLQIAFKKYSLIKGIWGSPWAGLRYFQELFSTPKFYQVLRNTLLINFYRILFQFPMPILFALMMNECRNLVYKRVVQTVSYLPHFLSWVIIAALFNNMLALDTGIVNRIAAFFGGKQRIFLSEPSLFRSILIVADIWKTVGWGTIVYLAALTAIDPSLYEAAVVDGAGKLRRIWHITLPGIRSTMVVLLIMRTGAALTNDVEMVLMFYNPLVYEVGDVLGTYLYRLGIGQMKYSFTTAAGFFTSVVGMLLMLSTQAVAHRMGERGLW